MIYDPHFDSNQEGIFIEVKRVSGNGITNKENSLSCLPDDFGFKAEEKIRG